MRDLRFLSVLELAEGKAFPTGTRRNRDGKTYVKMTDGTWERFKEKKMSRADRVHDFVSRNMSQAAKDHISKYQAQRRKSK